MWKPICKLIAVGLAAAVGVPEAASAIPVDAEWQKYIQPCLQAGLTIGALVHTFIDHKAEPPKPKDPPRS